ncbi:MAG: class I SAM-dependent methyltransferase [Lachnospiraceae bacterium]|nr:class I SAM-dependent methyltransferase [Lachnospiraceae bacterium]
MDLNEMKKITSDTELVNEVYNLFDEKSRLNCSNAARVEFTTTVKYIEKYLKQGMRILDIGAGAGEYSLYFANKGYSVNAVELADKNVEEFRKRITDNVHIELRQGNALDLSYFGDETFDVVLLFGPLYHLHEEKDRTTAIREAKRVLKKDGTMFVAFINNDMIPYTEWGHDKDYLLNGNYDKETFKTEDFPFVFFNLSQCREMLTGNKLDIIHQIASDGMSELLQNRINALDDEGYLQYLKLHLFYCEKPEHLGKTNHFLFVVKKLL